MRLRDAKGKIATIVGVALDVRHAGLDAQPEPQIYSSILQNPTISIGLMLRTRADAKTAGRAIEGAVRAVDPELPVFGVRTMRDVMSTSIARRRFLLELITAFALTAVALAALGVYSVVSFMVLQRRSEFGVRIALGAEAADIVRLVAWPALRVTAIGAGAGILAAFAAVHVLADLLFGVSAADPVSFIAATATMALVAIVACVAPLRRAVRTSPLEALRT
jgi:putative ABC transport system permease protein